MVVMETSEHSSSDVTYRMVPMPTCGNTVNTVAAPYVSVETEDTSSRENNRINNSQRRSCCNCCSLEFQWNKLGFGYSRKDHFTKSQWLWPPVIFVIYRFMASAYLLAWLVYTAVAFPTDAIRFPWPVWLTNWAFLLLNAHMFLACLIAVTSHDNRGSHCCNRPSSPTLIQTENIPESEALPSESSDGRTSTELSLNFGNFQNPLPWYIKLDWFIFAMISNISFIVSIIYFAVLFPVLLNIDHRLPLLSDLHLHLLNSVVILIEVAISGIPVRLLHVIYPLGLGLTYIIFSAIYWAFDHENVLYPSVLDWNSPGYTILVTLMLALIVVPLLQLMLFGLYNLRLKLYKYIYSTPS